MTLDPTSVEVLCVTLPKDHCVQVPWKYIKVCGYSDLFCKKKTWTKGHWPLDDIWPHIFWGHMCDSTQGSLCPSPMKIHQSIMWIQWTFCFAKTWAKGHWPLDDLWPHICWGHKCDSTQGSLCPSPMGIHQCMWIQWSILQITNQRSLSRRWPLTPHLLRSYVWRYPRIIVSKCNENTSKYVDKVTFLQKKPLNQRSLTPRWPLTPHLLGHKCDSTQGSLCPSPMGIHQCMWIQWSILQITTYIHILRTYYVHTTYRISDHIVSFWTTFGETKRFVCPYNKIIISAFI